MRLLFPTLLLPAAALAGTGFDGTWKTNMESLKTTGKPLVLLLAGGECACSSCNPPYTVKADGAEHKVTGQVQTVSDELTAKRVAAAPADSHPLSGSWVEQQHVGGDLRPVRYRMTAEGFQMRWNGQSHDAKFDGSGEILRGNRIESLKRDSVLERSALPAPLCMPSAALCASDTSPHSRIRPPVRARTQDRTSAYLSRVRPALSLIGTVAGVWAARIAAEHLGSRYQNWRESRRAGTIGHQLLKHWTGTTEIDIRDGRDVTPPPGAPRSPRPTRPLEIVQIDHMLADIMVVDEVQRGSMGRPWVRASGAS